jgi:uncharacterized protein (DUF1015 family)
MAEIRPFKAWRYNDKLSENIEALTSPLFDVVSEKQRSVLYQNPLNSIHLSVPEKGADVASHVLEKWKVDEVIKQDVLPGIYVYYQYFKMAGSPKILCRKGFICYIRVYDWSENVILRHENTIPKSVNDRIELLEKTELNVSPTHGLYTDKNYELETYMDEAMRNPLLETEDYQGVRDVLAVIHDANVIQKFIDVIRDKKIILADGHHRYEGSMIYKKQKALSPSHTGQEGYNFHMMYLTNTEAGDFRILPTHRLINGIEHFDEHTFVKRLDEFFTVRTVEDSDTLNEVIEGSPWTFGVLFKDAAYKIKLRPEAFIRITWPFPDEIKALDLTVLHYFVIERVLGIPGKDQRRSEKISFDRSFSDCLAKVIRGKAQMALITQEVSIDDVIKVCNSGFTMPQKSTYFYPKVVCGFVFGSISQNEFQTPPYSRF